MTAADRARELVARGNPYPLAIHIAAREFGDTTLNVARRLKRKKATRRDTPKDAWWLK